MTTLPHSLLNANAHWAKTTEESDPGFFRKSAQGQSPKVLWIGCSDSRVPESVITGARPGDVFVHRNIANQFHPNDDSALAVLEYAVGVVGVEHVIIAGHTHCGGAKACLEAAKARLTRSAPTKIATDSPLTRWLAPLTDLVASLDGLADADADDALDRVVHENIKRQVANICEATPVREAWAAGKSVSVYGWVYDLASGRIKDLEVSRGPTG